MYTKNHKRREFIQKAVLAGITTIASAPFLPAMATEREVAANKKGDGYVFLFQGDSITDGNRGRSQDPNHIMGHGYAFSIASRVGARYPEKGLTFYNKGISGNTVPELADRWQEDTLDIKPDVLSILVGVNDIAQALRKNSKDDSTKFEDGYRKLLDQTKADLPHCLLVLCEPFIAPVGNVKDQWPAWEKETQKKQEVVQRLAKEYQTVFVPLQKVFDQASNRAPADYWIWDGIHPTVPGHELISQEWLKQVGQVLPFLKRLT